MMNTETFLAEYQLIFCKKNIFPASRGRLSRRGKKEAFLPRRERPLQTGKKYSAYSSYQFSDYA